MKFGPVVHEEMSSKDISYLELWQHLCSVDWNPSCNFGKRYHKEQSWEFFFEFGLMVQMEMLFKRYFLSGALTGFCSVEHNHLCNLGKRYYEEQLCEIILNLGQWFRRCCLKDFLSQTHAALLFSWPNPFMQLKEASWGTFMLSYMKFWQVVRQEMAFKEGYLEPWWPSYTVERNHWFMQF